MKKLSIVFLIVLTLALNASEKAKLFKAPNDPCPSGTHEVFVTDEFKVVKLVNKKEELAEIKETRKICRDNKNSGLEERTLK